MDIVRTGPQTPEVPVRLTGAVLVDVIRSATERLTVVSLAADRVALVLDELAAATARGVDVRLVLETSEASGGRLAMDAATAFASLGATVGFWVWPAEQRPRAPRRHGRIARQGGHRRRPHRPGDRVPTSLATA